MKFMCITILMSSDTYLDLVKLFSYRVCRFTQQQYTEHTNFLAFGHLLHISIDNHVLPIDLPTYINIRIYISSRNKLKPCNRYKFIINIIYD